MRTPVFLPQLRGLRVDDILVDESGITVALTTVRAQAPCPRCGRRSRRVHSRYRRHVADLPWSGATVTLQVGARRFFCRQRGCTQRIFCERLPHLVGAGARRSHGLRTAQQGIGFALGGRAGARLAAPRGLGTGRMTLLRLVRASPTSTLANGAPLRVLGIDDWARRRGQTYGTILVDLERHQVVDLLPARTAEGVASWLAQHPGIEVISRDRAGAYADGARQGAPAAVQVADRWHLLHNLREAMERLLTRHHVAVAAANMANMAHQARQAKPPELASQAGDTAGAKLSATSVPTLPATSASSVGAPAGEEADAVAEQPPLSSAAWAAAAGLLARPPHPPGPCPAPLQRAKQPTTGDLRDREARRARRVARYEQVHALHAEGVSHRAIAQQLQMGKATVRHLLQAEVFPERRLRTRPLTVLTPFAPYLRERWNAGQHNAAALWRELQRRGFTGSCSTVRHTLAGWRSGPARPGRPRAGRPSAQEAAPAASPAPAAVPIYSVRQATWLLLLRPDDLDPDEQQFVRALSQTCPQAGAAYRLAQEFFTLVRTRATDELAPWVTEAEEGELPELRSFAAGLRRDWPAVVAAVTSSWSNGQTEGQVNRLKLLKRQMYGRANFDLLRLRFLRGA